MACAVDPYQYTATGILGDKRETMLENELLLRDELGRCGKRGYKNYPGNELRYGRPNVAMDGGAPEALRGWASGIHFPEVGSGKKNTSKDRDFMALNRCAVQAGLTTAAENFQYRTTHDIRKKSLIDDSSRTVPRRLPPSMVFGMATRPSTPIHDLLENRYQAKWLQERRSLDMARQSTDQKQRVKQSKVYETRASILRTYTIPVQSAPLWKMPKFTNSAVPHLTTFRTHVK